MRDHKIEIFVKGTPLALSYSDPEKEVKPGDRVQWSCDSHDYAIQFANAKSPFDPPVLSLSKAAKTLTDRYTVRARKGRGKDPHKYTVAVHVNDPSPILTDDPIIIVDDE